MTRRCVATLALSLVWLTGACFGLEQVETEECGNQVLDKEEDCDLFVDGAPACGMPGEVNECFYTCDLDPDNVLGCPDGFGCGADKRCRRASNTFELQSRIPFSAPSFEIGDFDGDGNPDVIGATANRLNVAFGSSTGTLETLEVAPTGAPRPFFSLADLNGDNRTDVIAATLFGISVHLGTPDRLLQPQPFPVFTIPNGGKSLSGTTQLPPVLNEDGILEEKIDVFSVVRFGGDLFVDLGDSQFSSLAGLPGIDSDLDLVFAGIDTPLMVASLDDTADQSDVDEFFFTYDGAARVWVLSLVPPPIPLPDPLPDPLPPTFELRQVMVIQGGYEVFGRPLASDLDSDGDLDLSLSVRHPDGTIGLAVGLNTNGTLADTGGMVDRLTAFPLLELQQTSEDRLLIAGDFDGHPGFDFVTTNVAFFSHSDDPGGSFADSVDFLDAALGDFNNDGRTDIIGISATTLGAVVHLQTPTGRFNRFPLGTTPFNSEEATNRVIVGDFDGDFIDDAVMTAPGTTGKLDVFAFYGGSDGNFEDPRSLARFESISQAFLSPSLDGTIDNILLAEEKGDIRELSELRGDPSRSLLAPLLLIEIGDESNPGSLHFPIAAVAGNFVEGEPPGIVAATARLNNPGPTCPNDIKGGMGTTSCSYSWKISGDGSGELLRDQTRPEPVPLEIASFGCRSFIAGNVLGQSTDQLLMVANSPTCPGPDRLAVIDFSGKEPTLVRLALPAEADGELVDVIVAELDGDDSVQEIAVGFRQQDGNGGGVAIYNAETQLEPTELVSFGEFRPFGLTAADFTGDGIAEIGIAGTQNADAGGGFETWLAEIDPDTGEYGRPGLRPQLSTGRFVRSADMNSDGVVDLVVGDDVSITVFLGIPARPRGDVDDEDDDSVDSATPSETDEDM